MKRHLFVMMIILAVSGCLSRKVSVEPAPPESDVPVKSATQVEVPPDALPVVPSPPKFTQPDWHASLEPLVESMLNTEDIIAGKALLPGSINNRTNGSLQMVQATSVLYDVLSTSQKFTLVSSLQLAKARQVLGLSENDSLGLRSNLIGLARYLGAWYVLYTDVSGDTKSPDIRMQLMSVQTGEIIWSGNGVVKYTHAE